MTNSWNPQQQKVIAFRDGALCVDACAGTGKTATITERYARMIESGVRPNDLLLVTFTVKAANEMAERIYKRTGHRLSWATNFHKLCVRLLRLYPLGIPSGFSIADEGEKNAILRRIAKGYNLKPDAKWFKSVEAQIEENRLFVLGYRLTGTTMQAKKDSMILQVANDYEESLIQANKLDFDKIILATLAGLRRFPQVAAEIGRRWKYVTVDEAQDTDRPQFDLLAFLAPHGNICLVGDMDQSIFAFRGADYENLRRFIERFKAQRLPLEINYRSKAEILDLANAVIAENEDRLPKTMRPTLGGGGNLVLLTANDQFSEAEAVANLIVGAIRAGESPSKIAVLYRISSLSRLLEAALGRKGIPYRTVGGLRFWDRAEVKTVIAFAEAIAKRAGLSAWKRIFDALPIGVGEKTFTELVATKDIESAMAKLPGKKGVLGAKFASLLQQFRANWDPMRFQAFLEEIGYLPELRKLPQEEYLQRFANVMEAISAMRDFDTIQDFLDEISLGLPKAETDLDELVTLSTIHAAKGLEWSRVFVLGTNEGILPHTWSMGSKKATEEERRLLYVAVTRAQHNLSICNARTIMLNGVPAPSSLSQFMIGKKIPAIAV